MQVLVVVDAAHGCDHDVCGPIDGELAVPLTVRVGSPGAETSEVDHVLGIETSHLAPAAEVVDIDVPREVVVDSIHESLARRGDGDDPELAALADALAAAMLDLAGRYPVGTVLARCGDGPHLVATPPAPPVRRPVCGHPHRAR